MCADHGQLIVTIHSNKLFLDSHQSDKSIRSKLKIVARKVTIEVTHVHHETSSDPRKSSWSQLHRRNHYPNKSLNDVRNLGRSQFKQKRHINGFFGRELTNESIQKGTHTDTRMIVLWDCLQPEGQNVYPEGCANNACVWVSSWRYIEVNLLCTMCITCVSKDSEHSKNCSTGSDKQPNSQHFGSSAFSSH